MSSLSGGDDPPTLAEWIAIAISVAVTLLLFGFLAWQAATVPADGTPTATVTGTQPTAAGSAVTVEVSNPAAAGFEAVTVGVDCANAPNAAASNVTAPNATAPNATAAARSITVEHLPARASRQGTIVCPAGADDPSASVRSWIEP